MRKTLAVSLLDIRRLGFSLVGVALVAGLIPALATGLGAKVAARDGFTVVLCIVGAVAGARFGGDFAEGRASFYFARPLPTWSLILGRTFGVLAIAGATFVAFMGSYWISSRGRTDWSASLLTPGHLEALSINWSMGLFVALAVAAQGRFQQGVRTFRDMVMIPVRLFLALATLTLTFGLFADVMLRAYLEPTPLKILFGSWVVAAFVASCAGITAGRTERLRIAWFQNRVVAIHLVLMTVAVIGAWIYILHPGQNAILSIEHPTWGSPDGRSAFVHATVDRGDPRRFQPVFLLDVASGQARPLNSDPVAGPWTSADGATVVWSEATPLFFRPIWRFLGGATTFRVRTSSGETQVLPMPSKLPDGFNAAALAEGFGMVEYVLPAPDGDVFAVFWNGRLTFTSRSRGELADLDLEKPVPRSTMAEAFLPSGELRVATVSRGAPPHLAEFVDIDPRSGILKPRASMEVGSVVRIQFDKSATRALLTSGYRAGRGATVSLIDLGPGADSVHAIQLAEGLFPNALFMADGRIAVTAGGMDAAWGKQFVRIFSATGQNGSDVIAGEGPPPRLGGEMFAGILAVNLAKFTEELSLIDSSTGAVVLRLPGFSPLRNFDGTPPPGSPSARLLQKEGGKLYELPSLTAEPRLLLPLGNP